MTINILETSREAELRIEALITEAIRKAMTPPPDLNLVEWADEYRYLPDNSAESGRWKTDRVEAAREPMLSVSNPDVKEVTVMSCIQFMKTELMLNTALYYMHQEPSPMMYVAPKKETAEAWSKERLVKSVNATPVVRDIFSGNRRGEGNTILQKQFAGGQISIVSARNPTDLAMRACRIMMFDETDKYPINVGAGEGGSGGEGDPIAVAWGRATTYGRRAKKLMACSPTVQGKSRIEAEYLKSDMRQFYQPCPHCDHAKVLDWTDVIIPRDDNNKFQPKKAAIRCIDCGVMWSESDRHKSIRNGYWKARKPEITHHHGYQVSSLASPFTPVVVLAQEFVDAQGSQESLKAFYNTRMAVTWREVGEQPDWERLYERNRESYKMGEIPEGGLIITMGIDVQKTYMPYEIVAWGRRDESWSIEKGAIEGDITDDETKERLTQFLDRMLTNHCGVEVPIMKVNIDSGYNTQEVYSFVRNYGSDRVVAIKGEDSLKTALGTPRPVDVKTDGKVFSRGLMKWGVGSSVLKEQVYRWLNAKKPTDEQLEDGMLYPKGYCHFPEYDEEYFKQLTAEQFVMKTDNRGFHTYIWEKLRPDNHFLDCRIYARSAAIMLQTHRMNEDDWQALEAIYYDKKAKKQEKTVVKPTKTSNNRNNRRKSNWIKRR